MLVTVLARGAADVVEMPERLDAATAPELRQAIAELQARGRHRLVLDLHRVQFCDSSGLSVLVTALKASRAAGGDTVLLRLTPAAQRVIRITQLHQAFAIFDDEAAAVAALS